MRYRKKPVEITAIRWMGKISDLEPFFNGKESRRDLHITSEDNVLHIHTLEGTMACPIGSWVIKGVKGEIYPCRDDVFQETYEPCC